MRLAFAGFQLTCVVKFTSKLTCLQEICVRSLYSNASQAKSSLCLPNFAVQLHLNTAFALRDIICPPGHV